MAHSQDNADSISTSSAQDSSGSYSSASLAANSSLTGTSSIFMGDYVLDPKYAQDPEQCKIINLDAGKHLVLAPPGCGKTDILAERVVRTLRKGVEPSKMLCLTFTNRAARGMRERIAQRLGVEFDFDIKVESYDQRQGWQDYGYGYNFAQSLSAESRYALHQGGVRETCCASVSNGAKEALGLDLFVGNVHRFCAHYLFSQQLLSANTTILDDQDARSIMRSLLGFKDNNEWDIEDQSSKSSSTFILPEAINKALKLQHLCSQLSLGVTNFELVDQGILEELKYQLYINGVEFNLANVLSVYHGENPHFVFLKELKGHFSEKSFTHLLQLAKLYEDFKQENSFVDFEDLLGLTYSHASKHHSEISKYEWIQIDEVQDLSPLQFSIINLVTDQADSSMTLYLGDEQQAIFSFIGAQLETLHKLKEECGTNVHFLHSNYRSPRYLLDVFNSYAIKQLGMDPELLPQAVDTNVVDKPPLILLKSYSNVAESSNVARLVRRLCKMYPNEKVAILVCFNQDADRVSQALQEQGLTHFKISGTDLFTLKSTKLLIAHLAVLYSEFCIMAWARLIAGMRLLSNSSRALDFLTLLKSKAILPSDLVLYENSSYILEMDKALDGCYVVVDTETTGLDVFRSDIVQISALKMQGNRVVAKFDVLLETHQEIPTKLDGKDNPLLKLYNSQPHVERRKGLSDFLLFIGSCALVGYQIEFDYHILDNNFKRYCFYHCFRQDHPQYWDAFKAIRLLQPHLKHYKLSLLVKELKLQINNFHLAHEDTQATVLILSYIKQSFAQRRSEHLDMLSEIKVLAQSFRKAYAQTYKEALSKLYETGSSTGMQGLAGLDLQESLAYVIQPVAEQVGKSTAWGAGAGKSKRAQTKSKSERAGGNLEAQVKFSSQAQAPEQPKLSPEEQRQAELEAEPVLVKELRAFCKLCRKRSWINPHPKLEYIFRFLANDVINQTATPSLYEQLSAHMVDITTYREVDLCDSSGLQDNIFVSTLHKAKGLEFDNVILFNVIDGVYPFFNNKTEQAIQENARMFYVGMTRAKKRLAMSYSLNRVGLKRYGKSYSIELRESPFIASIRHFFMEANFADW